MNLKDIGIDAKLVSTLLRSGFRLYGKMRHMANAAQCLATKSKRTDCS